MGKIFHVTILDKKTHVLLKSDADKIRGLAMCVLKLVP